MGSEMCIRDRCYKPSHMNSPLQRGFLRIFYDEQVNIAIGVRGAPGKRTIQHNLKRVIGIDQMTYNILQVFLNLLVVGHF